MFFIIYLAGATLYFYLLPRYATRQLASRYIILREILSTGRKKFDKTRGLTLLEQPQSQTAFPGSPDGQYIECHRDAQFPAQEPEPEVLVL
jgi:hypothetical protein